MAFFVNIYRLRMYTFDMRNHVVFDVVDYSPACAPGLDIRAKGLMFRLIYSATTADKGWLITQKVVGK